MVCTFDVLCQGCAAVNLPRLSRAWVINSRGTVSTECPFCWCGAAVAHGPCGPFGWRSLEARAGRKGRARGLSGLLGHPSLPPTLPTLPSTCPPPFPHSRLGAGLPCARGGGGGVQAWRIQRDKCCPNLLSPCPCWLSVCRDWAAVHASWCTDARWLQQAVHRQLTLRKVCWKMREQCGILCVVQHGPLASQLQGPSLNMRLHTLDETQVVHNCQRPSNPRSCQKG